MKVEIFEFDKDYHTITDSYIIEVESVAEAIQHCNDRDWSGYSYSYKILEDKQ